ncbi:hypothetical protein H5410_056617 [Solanum commersonii]|uniref:Uncharacterized protein n=1 Tax=Solanum commersonii TaxID=4109 RepID=A0A9J5WKR7_SOLCO|nr:hypothetical protein H5410_056617 [Solanum commersonii]
MVRLLKQDNRKPGPIINQERDKGQQSEEHATNKVKKGRPIQDDYGALNSEEELDPDNQYIEEYDEEEEETSNHLIREFGSTFHNALTEEDYPQEVGNKADKPNNRLPSTLLQLPTDPSQGPNQKEYQHPKFFGKTSTLKKMHQLSMIAILEPFADNSHLNIVRIQLQIDQALFWSGEITGNNHENSEQHIIGEFKHSVLTERFMVSLIYAKCQEHMRRPLWDRLLHYASRDIPWCTIGDFNVIKNIEEKLGGMPYNMNKSFDFISVIEACGLIDLGYTGLPFTWCNQRAAQVIVWKRLDRSMVNDKWLEVMPQTTIEHLSSVGFDHSPLLIEMVRKTGSHTKYFKFLHRWVDNKNFLETVQKCWDREVTSTPLRQLHQKMKRLTTTLSNWSKKEYGDIYTKVKEFGETIRKVEEELLTNNTETLRQQLHLMNANYIRYLKLEKSILK